MSQPVILNEDSAEEIAELLVGRRIVGVEEGEFEYVGEYGWTMHASGRLTLDNGTQVLVAPHEGGCTCSAGDYFLTHLAKVDNIITSVRLAAEDQTEPDEYGYVSESATSYRIYVVADAVEINAVQIDGDDGNGYYGTGYELIVLPPQP